MLDPVLRVSIKKIEDLLKLVRSGLISRDPHQVLANWADFARFAVKSWGTLKEQGMVEISNNRADFAWFTVVIGELSEFEVSISRGPNRKMVGEFRVICQNGGLLNTLGGYMNFWYIVNSANGADFATFIS